MILIEFGDMSTDEWWAWTIDASDAELDKM